MDLKSWEEGVENCWTFVFNIFKPYFWGYRQITYSPEMT